MELKTALIIGATGLTGKELTKILCEAPEYERVIVLVRRPTGMQIEKLMETIIDFDQLETYQSEHAVDHVFCCIGTTIKKAKTKEAFRKVDYEYPMAIGRWAKKNDISQYMLVSSVGADANSKILYSRTKGQVEEGLKDLQLNGLHIFRPSLLLGQRDEKRIGESIATFISTKFPFLYSGPFKQYSPIQGKTVAKAMYQLALQGRKGVYTYSSNEIDELGSLLAQSRNST